MKTSGSNNACRLRRRIITSRSHQRERPAEQVGGTVTDCNHPLAIFNVPRAEKPMRPRRKRPCYGCYPQTRNEISSPHLITTKTSGRFNHGGRLTETSSRRHERNLMERKTWYVASHDGRLVFIIVESPMSKRKAAKVSKLARSKVASRAQRARQAVVRSRKPRQMRSAALGSTSLAHVDTPADAVVVGGLMATLPVVE